MLKRIPTFLLVVLLCMGLATGALAKESAGDLAKVQKLTVEEIMMVASDPGAVVSRGDFASMLAFAADLIAKDTESAALPEDVDKEAPHANAVMALLREGIMKGTSANTVHPDDKVTGFQALVLVARTLGIPEGADLHALLVKEGIADESLDLTGGISAKAAAELLMNAFGTDREAKALMETVNAKNSQLKSFRLKGDMTMKFKITGVPELEGQTIEMNATTESALSKDGKALHQIIEMDMSFIGGETMKMEQYMDKEYIYTSIPEGGWMKMENPVPVVFDEEYMTKQLEVTKGLDGFAYYRILGVEEVEGKQTHKIAFYSRLGDLTAFFEKMGGVVDQQTLETLAKSNELLQGMSMKGIQWIGVEDGLTYKADIDMALSMKGGDPEAITMEMNMKALYFDYDADIVIVIPQEARAAKTLEELAGEMENI